MRKGQNVRYEMRPCLSIWVLCKLILEGNVHGLRTSENERLGMVQCMLLVQFLCIQHGII